MKLVKFGDDLYINPEQVVSLLKLSTGTNIVVNGDEDAYWHVPEDIDTVAKALTGEQ